MVPKGEVGDPNLHVALVNVSDFQPILSCS